MFTKKSIKLALFIVLLIIIVLAGLDYFAFGNDGDLLTAVGFGLIFLFPALVILAIADGLFRVGQNLTSSKISKSEKRGTLRRLLIVLSVVGIFVIASNFQNIIDLFSGV